MFFCYTACYMAFLAGSSSPERPQPLRERSLEPDLAPETEGEVSSVEADALALRALEEARAAEAAKQHILIPVPEEAQLQDPLLVKTEGVLEAGLDDLFTGLSEPQRAEFTAAGKGLAQKLYLGHRKMKGDDMVKLVQEWLYTLPAVSRSYLGQEALLKTLALVQMFKQESSPS